MNVIVLKLQWPLAGESSPPILAYDQNRRYQRLLQPTRDLADLFKGREKVYVEATVINGDVIVQREIADQPW